MVILFFAPHSCCCSLRLFASLSGDTAVLCVSLLMLFSVSLTVGTFFLFLFLNTVFLSLSLSLTPHPPHPASKTTTKPLETKAKVARKANSYKHNTVSGKNSNCCLVLFASDKRQQPLQSCIRNSTHHQLSTLCDVTNFTIKV